MWAQSWINCIINLPSETLPSGVEGLERWIEHRVILAAVERVLSRAIRAVASSCASPQPLSAPTWDPAFPCFQVRPLCGHFTATSDFHPSCFSPIPINLISKGQPHTYWKRPWRERNGLLHSWLSCILVWSDLPFIHAHGSPWCPSRAPSFRMTVLALDAGSCSLPLVLFGWAVSLQFLAFYSVLDSRLSDCLSALTHAATWCQELPRGVVSTLSPPHRLAPVRIRY